MRQVSDRNLKEENLKELLGLIHRHYDFLKLFWLSNLEHVGDSSKYTLSQLADQTKKDIGYLSRLVEKLRRRGILEIHEEPSPHGRPYKYSQLSLQAIRLVKAIEEATKPPEILVNKPVKFNKRQVAELLSALNPKRIKSKDIRNRRAVVFNTYARLPQHGLCEQEEVLETFEHIVERPNEFVESVEPEIVERFYEALNGAIQWMLEKRYEEEYDGVQKAWQRIFEEKKTLKKEAKDFAEYVYGKSVEHVRDKSLSEMLRQKFLTLIKTYYRERAEKQKEILNTALYLCMDKDLKPEESLFSTARDIILRVLEGPDENLKWEVHDILLEKANSNEEDEKKKFEPIFQEFSERLLQPKSQEAEVVET